MTTVVLDKAGRVVIPKILRRALGLEPGDTLELQSEGEQMILRPARVRSGLQKKRGIWVFHGSKSLSIAATNAALGDIRTARDRQMKEPRD